MSKGTSTPSASIGKRELVLWVADLLGASTSPDRRSPAQLIRLGHVRTELATAAAVCRDMATQLSAVTRDQPRTKVTLARAGVAACIRRILSHARSTAGPAVLAFDEDLTRAVDDLALYVAQLNADSDAGWLGGS